jgi:hypothetical protein
VPKDGGHRPLPPPLLITLEHGRRRHGSRLDPSTTASSLHEGNGDIVGHHPLLQHWSLLSLAAYQPLLQMGDGNLLWIVSASTPIAPNTNLSSGKPS